MEEGAVEGIPAAGHAHFIPVVDIRDTGHGELDHGSQSLQTGSALQRFLRRLPGDLLCTVHGIDIEIRGQIGAHAFHVMRAEKVHEGIVQRLGIIVSLVIQEIPEGIGIDVSVQEGQHMGAEGIVHHRIQRVAQRIVSAVAVAFLQNAVFPDFAQDHGIGLFFLAGFPDEGKNIVRQFIRHVQTPSGCSAAKPGLYHAVLAGNDEILPYGIFLIHFRKIPEVPPAFVAVIEMMERIPGEIRGLGSLTGTHLRIVAIAVEVHAVGTGVGENAVIDDADPQFLRLAAELLIILHRPQDRIHGHVIGSVVTVVGFCLHDGIEIDNADTQIVQIIQLGDDPFQRAAVKIIRTVKVLAGTGLPFYRFVRGFVEVRRLTERTVIFQSLPGGVVIGGGKTVREDLIHDAVTEPLRCLKVLLEYREAEAQPPLGGHNAAETGGIGV